MNPLFPMRDVMIRHPLGPVGRRTSSAFDRFLNPADRMGAFQQRLQFALPFLQGNQQMLPLQMQMNRPQQFDILGLFNQPGGLFGGR